MSDIPPVSSHYFPRDLSDRAAFAFVRFLRLFADMLFAGRYGHRAVVLETVAALPGMVGGTHRHLRSLRRMEDDDGRIRILLDEAENERMHLMTFIQIVQPSRAERVLIWIAQAVFYNFYFLFYLFFPGAAHRVIGYFEEESVYSYTEYLAGVDDGTYVNVPAPQIAIEYWHLDPDARLREVIIAVRQDETRHRDANHGLADELV